MTSKLGGRRGLEVISSMSAAPSEASAQHRELATSSGALLQRDAAGSISTCAETAAARQPLLDGRSTGTTARQQRTATNTAGIYAAAQQRCTEVRSATAAGTSRVGWADERNERNELCSGCTAVANIRGGGLGWASEPAQLSGETAIEEEQLGGTAKAGSVRGQLVGASGEWHHRSVVELQVQLWLILSFLKQDRKNKSASVFYRGSHAG